MPPDEKGKLAMAMPSSSAHSCPDTDVLVVGHGPVGQVLGILLAQRGWLTTVVDPSTPTTRFASVVGFDGATMRVLAGAGLGPRLLEIGVPATSLEFDNSTLRFFRPKCMSELTMFHQTALESALAERAARLPNLQILRGREATLLIDRGLHAEAVVSGEVITAYWAVGCDGMRSFHDDEDRWRSGRILLAGDSAHLAPVLAGPGMCAGIRDAANLAWKLDLVLRGKASDALLDSYALERPSTGKLRAGILHTPVHGRTGQLFPQARVANGDQHGMFDEVVGRGFVLLCTEDPNRLLSGRLRTFLDDIDTHVIRLLPAGTPVDRLPQGAVVDVDDVYVRYLTDGGEFGALVRPDFYLFGTAHDAHDLAELVADLRAQLIETRFRPRPIE